MTPPTDRPLSDPSPQLPASRQSTYRALRSVLVLLATGFVLVLGLFYRIGAGDAREHMHQQLEAVLDAKAATLAAWQREQIDDAAILQDPSFVDGPIELALAGSASAAQRERALASLVRTATMRGHKAMLLLDAAGRIVVSTARDARLHEPARRRLDGAAYAGTPEMSAIHLDADGEAIVDVIAPLRDEHRQTQGFLVSRIAVVAATRSIVAAWAGAAKTGEAMLLAPLSDRPLLLTPRRLVADDLADGVPRALDDPASRQAAAATTLTRIEDADYRQQTVLAVARRLDGPLGVLVVKSDRAEALSDLHRQMLLLGLSGLFLIGLASLGVIKLWNIQTTRDRAHLAREIERRDELRTLQNRLNDAQAFGRLGSWERNLATGELWWSEGMFELTGATRPAHSGENIYTLRQFVHAADRARYDAALATHPRDGERGSVECRIVTANGDVRHVLHQWQTIRDADGEPVLRRGVTQDISERVRAENVVREQLDMLRTLVDNVPGGVTLFDADLRLRLHNRQYQTLLDYPDDLFREAHPAFEVFARYDAWRGEYGPGDPEAQTATAVAEAREPKRRVFERARPDGTAIEVRDAPLAGGGFVTIITDVTARKRNEQRLRLSDKIIASSPTAVLITNPRNQVVFVNPAFTAITGYELRDVLGKNPRILSAGRHDAQFYRDFWHAIETTDHWAGEIWDRRKDGSVYPKWLSVHVLRDDSGRLTNYVGMFTDITERKQAEQRIAHLAHHDPLTGLANRVSLESRLEQAIADARRNNRRLALLFIDLDRFKMINDSLGHAVGDLLLMEIAGRLAERLRESDVVARLGGDEFVVVLPDLPDTAHAALVAQTLLGELARPIKTPGHELHTSGSIGIALFPDDGDSVDALMQNADTAMYEAKGAGRNQMRFFTREMSTSANDRLQLENSLRGALIERQFELHYQPQVRPADGRVVGVEALLRWAHPAYGMIGPDRFIPVAEETGLIVEIGEWVLREACRQGRAWKDAGSPLRVSVNLSARQLRSRHIVNTIAFALADSGFEPEWLELEITESALMEHPQEAVELLRAIRGLGVSLALDDFGTGYSSLSYLKLFPLDRLKIDRSFVRDIETDPDDRAIALSTIALAHTLGLSVVAEGVETAAQRDFLVTHGCEEAQGWFYGKALPPAALEVVLARGTLP